MTIDPLQTILDAIELEAREKSGRALRLQNNIRAAFALVEAIFGPDAPEHYPEYMNDYGDDFHIGFRCDLSSAGYFVKRRIQALGLTIASDIPQPSTGPHDHILHLAEFPGVRITLWADAGWPEVSADIPADLPIREAA